MPTKSDITGRKFGRLTAIGFHSRSKNGRKWNCVCDCGNKHITTVNALTSGNTKSCGCLHREACSINGKATRLSAAEISKRLTSPTRCSQCKEVKPSDDFGPLKSVHTGVEGKRTVCKRCQAKSVRKWEIGHPVEDYDRKRRSAILRRYGINGVEYEDMFANQHGVCAICGKPPMDKKKRLQVDHDHSTLKVRELLCLPCNVFVGRLEANDALLLNIVDYLNRHESRTALVLLQAVQSINKR